MTNLTSIILTKNEQDNIVDAVESVLFSDHILIIDDFSSDNTLELIINLNKSKIKIFQRELKSFADQRNFALNKVSTNYVLFIDADERVSESLSQEILHCINSLNYSGYKIKRVDTLWGHKMRYGDLKDNYHIRLAKINSGKWKGKVHEKWDVKGNIGELKNELIHFPHQSVSDFVKELNYYSNLRSKELFEKNVKFNLITIVVYPLGKFLFLYLIKKGFIEHTRGFTHAMLMSFYTFLVRAKLYMLWKKN